MGAAENFIKRFKTISRDIEKHALGGEHENAMKRESCKALRQAVRAAEESAYVARQAGRSAEISRLSLESRQKAHQDPYGDVGYGDKYRVKGYR